METTRLAEFGRIDATADPDYFVRFLDAACAAASFRAYKRRMIDLLELAPGRVVLDVGCGTGDDVRDMATLVGPGGKVVGIDNSQAMIGVARRRAEGGGLPVEFCCGDCLGLPFEAKSFDGCRADRSLMHVPDAGQALAEMKRVTRPGGRVVVFEVDFETLFIGAQDRGLARRIVNAWCDSFRDGWLGRHMPALVAAAGLQDLLIEPFTLMLTPELAHPLIGRNTVQRAMEKGTVTALEGEAWLHGLADMDRSGRFFAGLTGFLVAARCPA